MFSLNAQFPALTNGSSCYKGTSSSLSSSNSSRLTQCNFLCSSVSSNRKSVRTRRAAGSAVLSSVVKAPERIGVENRESRDGVLTLKDGLPVGLSMDLMPKHVTFVMDGNARWARENGLSFEEGYEVGMSKLKDMVEYSYKWGVKTVSFFAFSTENWRRPPQETDFLMKLFEDSLRVDMDRLMRLGIQFCMVGDASQLPKSLQRLVIEAEEITKNNSQFKLITAINYSGQYDIVQACKKVANKLKDGEIQPTDINELFFEKQLETSRKIDAPPPDLLVRTSGELRLSNYFLWQLAYTEFSFLGSNWPDLGEVDYVEALRSFQSRNRRFGKKSG